MKKLKHFTIATFGSILFSCIFLTSSFAFYKPRGPFQVGLKIESTIGSEAAVLIIQCTTYVPFTKGELSLKFSQDTVPILDYDKDERLKGGRVTIWSGNSDSVFIKEFRYPFNLKISEKAFFEVVFIGSINDGKISLKRNIIFLHNIPSGIETSPASFDQLYDIEIFNEINRKGYENLSRREIMKFDPDLAERIKKMSGKWSEELRPKKRHKNKF